jgi:hypothetical protein
VPSLRKEFPSPSGFTERPKHKKTTMTAIGPKQVAHCGLSNNKNNGIYNTRGFEFDVVKKLSFEASNQHCKGANGGLQPNLNQIVRDCNVSPNYVKKITREPKNDLMTMPTLKIRRN